MQIRILKDEMLYDGKQLKPQWAFKQFGIKDDAIVLFRGPANVPLEDMCDLGDTEPIYAKKMMHMIVEVFPDIPTLRLAYAYQKVIVALVAFYLEKSILHSDIEIDGDDIKLDGKKASVSIAVADTVSVRVHFALNIEETKPWGFSMVGEEAVTDAAFLFKRMVDNFGEVERYKTTVR